MHYRFATLDDVQVLSIMNRQLTEDEGHRNRFKPVVWFQERMVSFLTGEYTAVLFERGGEIVAYALYMGHPEHSDTIYLRQLFVNRKHRRLGIGREAIRLLKEEILPPGTRLTLEVLAGNQVARDFYEAIGFREFSIELELPVTDQEK